MIRPVALAAAVAAAFSLSTAEPAAARDNMDRCVFFSWTHSDHGPSLFEYRLKNYCKRRVYVQVCLSGTRTCREHYLNKIPRAVVNRMQDPSKRAERMTFRAVSN